MHHTLPVAIIGAGPIGLAAASHLHERGETPVVLEAGPHAGHAVKQWEHVQLFSPWRYNVDDASERLLRETGWTSPEPDVLPSGKDLREHYLLPLATRTILRRHIQYDSRVIAVTRKNWDKVRTDQRDQHPFVLKIKHSDGSFSAVEARAVIDASGTWFTPNPIGSDGTRVPGEEELADHITYGIPDVLRTSRGRFAGKRVMVLGSGHSAMQVVLDLLKVKATRPETKINWVMRKASRQALENTFGNEADDELPARGALGAQARRAKEEERITMISPFLTQSIERNGSVSTLRVLGRFNGDVVPVVADEIVACTGFRPDLQMLREVRLALDPAIESVEKLAPMIDPTIHSCGTVPPHGIEELKHPESKFFLAGMKSYGRAPTFLMITGYEQVRSIAAYLAGDYESAHRIELNLPETGVCSSDLTTAETSSQGCCGSEPATQASAPASSCCS